MPTVKRSSPIHDSPPKNSEKRTKENEPEICPVCCLTITESNDKVAGEDAIYCEGECKAWIHRKCLGMSKTLYDRLSNCEELYMCPTCTIFKQSSEIVELKNKVENLSSKLTTMKALEKRVLDLEQRLCSERELVSPPKTNSATVPPSSQAVTSTADDHISTMVTSFINEGKEKVKRCLNLIVHNLKESSSKDGASRQKDDVDQITSINNHVEVTPT